MCGAVRRCVQHKVHVTPCRVKHGGYACKHNSPLAIVYVRKTRRAVRVAARPRRLVPACLVPSNVRVSAAALHLSSPLLALSATGGLAAKGADFGRRVDRQAPAFYGTAESIVVGFDLIGV